MRQIVSHASNVDVLEEQAQVVLLPLYLRGGRASGHFWPSVCGRPSYIQARIRCQVRVFFRRSPRHCTGRDVHIRLCLRGFFQTSTMRLLSRIISRRPRRFQSSVVLLSPGLCSSTQLRAPLALGETAHPNAARSERSKAHIPYREGSRPNAEGVDVK